jgi:hypothetical protein
MLVKVRFDQYSNDHNFFRKNQNNGKHTHIVFLCHILTIQVDKQGLDTFIRKIHASNVTFQTLSIRRQGFRVRV